MSNQKNYNFFFEKSQYNDLYYNEIEKRYSGNRLKIIHFVQTLPLDVKKFTQLMHVPRHESRSFQHY